MAIIQYTGIVNQIRGKLNGSVFNKSKNSYTLQSKQMPRKGMTALQAHRRRQFGVVQRAWKTLSAAEKADAELAAANNPVFDRFGNEVILSGYNHWVKTNVIRVQNKLPILPDIETDPAVGFETDIIDQSLRMRFFSDGSVQMTSTLHSNVVEGTPTGMLSVLEVALPVSIGVDVIPDSFLHLGSAIQFIPTVPGQNFNLNVDEFVDFKYPVPGPDQKVWIRWKFYRQSSGSLIGQNVFIPDLTIVHV